MYGMSQYYVPDEVHEGSTLTLLLQNPGADEERWGIPACGKTGEVLNTRYLPVIGHQRGTHVTVRNVIRCRVGASNNLPADSILSVAAKHCAEAHGAPVRPGETLIVMGGAALKYHTPYAPNVTVWPPWAPEEGPVNWEKQTIHAWRGFWLPGKLNPVFAMVHPADTFRDPTMAWVTQLDLRKCAQGPRPKPERRWLRRERPNGLWLDQSPVVIAIDTEFDRYTKSLSILGCGVKFDDRPWEVLSLSNPTPELLVDWGTWLKALIQRAPVVFHNAMADIPVLEQHFGIQYRDYLKVHDTMLAHAALWCELPHTLDFLSSVYGQDGKLKHLERTHGLRYNYGDVLDTLSAWDALQQGLATDPQSAAVYEQQSLALLPLLLDARKRGLRVNKDLVVRTFNDYRTTLDRIRRYAHASVGSPVNLNSGHWIKDYLYTQRKYPVILDKDTKRPTSDDNALQSLRLAHSGSAGPVDAGREFTFDRDDDTHYSLVRRVGAGADPIIECRLLWAGLWQLANNYLVGLADGVINGHTDGARRKARTAYWTNGLTCESITDRIYPNFAIHAQKTGRWSTSEPPLAQLPASLRTLTIPDPGWIRISWDWSAIEPRLLQALCRSSLLKKSFDENFDLHTWTVCFMFGWEFPVNLVDPHRSPECAEWRTKYNWKGKDDPRRVFAKQARYELYYGGTGSNAAGAAAGFGLSQTELKKALQNLATSDPDYFAWRTRMEAQIRQTKVTRTFMGRIRRHLASGQAAMREGINQPMQGGVSDIFNTCAVTIYRQLPQFRWAWGMHDSQKWDIQKEHFTRAVFQQLRAIVERPYMINGQETAFPADFELIDEKGDHYDIMEWFEDYERAPYTQPSQGEPHGSIRPRGNVQ